FRSVSDLAKCVKRGFDFTSGALSRRKTMIAANELIHEIKNTTPASISKVSNNKEMKKIREFEALSSEEYLKGILKVKMIEPMYIRMIAEMRKKYKLPDSVINVLIDYSFFKNEKKVVVNYVLKIASSLSENAIREVKSAMNYLKNAFKNSGVKKEAKTYGKKQKYISEVE